MSGRPTCLVRSATGRPRLPPTPTDRSGDTLLLYLDQNYLSGIVKSKAALRELSAGLRLPRERGALERHSERRLEAILERDFPERQSRPSDRLDVRALALALPRCRFVTCDAFMADVIRRTGLDVRFRCELFTGRRADVERLRRRLERLS